MPIETYEDALAFWYGRVNYEQQGLPQDARQLHLRRIGALLERLGRPQDRFRAVHIAGTKGKGSTAALLSSLLRSAGQRTGLFTSPHLVSVEERVQVDGMPIGREELTTALREIEKVLPEVEAGADGRVTFFEIMTAVGFLHFAREEVETAVVEVGLGGRFDATNVLLPAVSVITSISFDHMQQLGPTLAAIAGEKAGILKPGRPGVCGVTQEEARAVVRGRAAEVGCPLQELHRDFLVEHDPGSVAHGRWPRVRFRPAEGTWTAWLDLPLWGAHQAANAALAWRTLTVLNGGPVPEETLASGLRAVHWPARLEVVGRRPWVVLDCAHNDGSIQSLVDWLSSAIPARRRLLILALSKDKELSKLLHLLAPLFDQAWMTRYGSSGRGADPAELAELWLAAGGGSVRVQPSPQAAWQEARQAAGPEDLICITGSVFLAGELSSMVRTQG